MAVGFKRIGRVQVVSEQKIQIKNLYKIFGNNAEGVMDLVSDGISKQELLETRQSNPIYPMLASFIDFCF